MTRPPEPPLHAPDEFIEFIIRGASPAVAREQVRPLPAAHFWLGNEAVWLSLPEDGVLRWAKQGWWRSAPGQLRADGRPHGAAASEPFIPVLHVPEGYGERGFQASGWNFPSQGCWDVVVTVGTGEVLSMTVFVAIPQK